MSGNRAFVRDMLLLSWYCSFCWSGVASWIRVVIHWLVIQSLVYVYVITIWESALPDGKEDVERKIKCWCWRG